MTSEQQAALDLIKGMKPQEIQEMAQLLVTELERKLKLQAADDLVYTLRIKRLMGRPKPVYTHKH